MGRNLTNLYVSESFQYLLQISGSDVTNGLGQQISGSIANPLTITVASASYAVSASHEIIKEVSSSYADFAASAESASYATTASYSLTAEIVDTASTASYVEYGNIVNKPTIISGSAQVSINGTTGDLSGSRVSGAVANATSASHAVQADSALSATSATSATSADSATSASHAAFAITSSLPLEGFIGVDASGSFLVFTKGDGSVVNAPISITGSVSSSISASHATRADVADTALSATTAISSSYATDASNADNILLTPNGTNTNRYVPFTATDNGDGALLTDPGILYNPSTNILTAGTFNGNLSGNATTATSATSASYASNAGTADTASYVAAANVDGTVALADEAEKVAQAVQNNTAATLAKGTPIHITGTTNGTALVIAASASNAATMPAHGVLMQQLSPGADGFAAILGQITGVNTSLFSSGDTVYVGANGGYTNVKPTGSNLIQNLGVVKKVDAVNGTGEIFGAGRSNDLPNIDPGYAWVGNGDSVPTAVTTSSFSVASAVSSSYANEADAVNDPNVAYINIDNSFSGLQTFNNIAVNGTGSFAYIQQVTGSAKIIGDAFIILNNDTPTERYAGVKVIDSGSNNTSSLQFDGQTNDWFYEYEGDDPTDHGVVIFGPEYSTKGSPIYPAANQLQKGRGDHHITGSLLFDDGSTVSMTGILDVTGAVSSSVGFKGDLTGTASTASYVAAGNIDGSVANAVSASHAINADSAISATTATSASHAVQADNATTADSATSATSASYATNAGTADSASYVAAANVDGTVATATSASHAIIADSALTATSATTATSASHAVNADIAISSSYASNAGLADNSSQLNGQAASFYLDASNINAGTIADTYLPATISSDITGNAATATSASFATTASYALSANSALSADSATSSSYASTGSVAVNYNASSGSIRFWQGSQSEYNTISGSATNDTIYFVTPIA